MSGAFSNQMLSQKLSEVNNSQLSIESLSRWCIFHQKKARCIVETWGKLFKNFPREKQVPFMYLANDILQNSKRKGSEYVNEFWKILPSALKSVSNSGDDHTMNVVKRLVDIWEERKVFGSRSHLLKDEMLGKACPSKLENNEKSSQFFKILKKDGNSLRIKLTIGCLPEKIISTFQSVRDEHFNEDMILDKCKTASHHVWQIEKDVDVSCAQGNTQGLQSTNELEAEEAVLRECVEKLEKYEATRASLVSHLKEALQKQESELESVRTQLNVAKAESEHANTLKQKLLSGSARCTNSRSMILTTHPAEAATIVDSYFPNIPNYATQQPTQPAVLFSNSLTTAEERHKKTAADLAAKLSAMSSPAEVLSSVFSSFVGQQASSGTAGLESASFTTSGPSIFPMEKKPRLEKTMQTSYAGPSVFPHQQLPYVPSQGVVVSSKPMSQPPQTPFLPPSTASVWQYTQTTGGMPASSYGYNGRTILLPQPPPPPASYAVMVSSRSMLSLQTQMPQQHQQQQQHPQPVTSGLYPSPGIGSFGQQPPSAVHLP